MLTWLESHATLKLTQPLQFWPTPAALVGYYLFGLLLDCGLVRLLYLKKISAINGKKTAQPKSFKFLASSSLF